MDRLPGHKRSSVSEIKWNDYSLNPRQTLKTKAAASPLKETDHKNWSFFSRHFKMYTVELQKGQEIWLKSPNIIDKQLKYSADGM